MALDFNRVLEGDTFRKYTEELNNIGTELTKNNNIFTQVESLTRGLGEVQKYKLTTDTGLAKSVSVRYLSQLTKPGFYYITGGTLATLPDKPKSMISSDTLVEVKPTRRNGEVIQQLTSLGKNSTDASVVYRFVSSEGNSEWMYFQTLVNNRYRNASLNVEGLTEPNIYFLGENNTGLPTEINKQEGTLKLYVDSNNNRYYEYFNIEEKLTYTGYKKQNQSSIDWSTSKTDPVEIQRYLIGNPTITEGVEHQGFGMLVYKDDNISWNDAVMKKLAEGKTNFTFYCQGGVEGSPAGRYSNRGMVISDVPSGSYGIYFAITNGGKIYTGAISNYEFTTPNATPSGNVLWKGALSFSTVNKKQTMTDSINNYDYIEIYTKLRTQRDSKGKDHIQHKAHKFYRDGDTYFSCTGSLLGGDFGNGVAPVQDVYRVGVEVKDTSFQILDSAINNSKAQYVTRIIGMNLLDT